MERMNGAGYIAGFFVMSALLITVQFSACATRGATHGHAAASSEGHGHAADEGVPAGASSYTLVDGVQEITTSYAQLWSSDNIIVKAGVPVRWYVEAAPGSLPRMGMACGKTIKIPGLGWGTDSYNDAEGHLTLVEGKNLVYEFTPSELGDILFTCWMGSECHYNYIHVTADGTYTSGEQTVDEGGEVKVIKVEYNKNDKRFYINGKATDIKPTVFENAMGKYNTINPKDILDYVGIQQADVRKFESSVNDYASKIPLERIYNNDLSQVALTAYEVLESKNEAVSVGYITERLLFEIRVTLPRATGEARKTAFRYHVQSVKKL